MFFQSFFFLLQIRHAAAAPQAYEAPAAAASAAGQPITSGVPLTDTYAKKQIIRKRNLEIHFYLSKL